MGKYIQSSLNYGIEVTANNRSIDFKTTAMGPERQATLKVGLYSIASFGNELKRAMTLADPNYVYTFSVDRTISGGTSNRVIIGANSPIFSLLFGTGTRNASSAASLMGYSATDKTGALSYQSQGAMGSIFLPTYPPQDFQPLGSIYDSKRSVNDSTSGRIETVSFTAFRNFEMRFKWILEGSSEYTSFNQFHIWLLRGGPVEFIPDITDPSGLSVGVPINLRTPLELSRMMPSLYDYFETPVYTFREQT
jgi:hypothetical protein